MLATNRFLMAVATLVFCILLLSPLSAQAEDWPRMRGAKHNNVSTEKNLLQEWPENGPKQLWVNNEGGLGYAGFAVVNGKLYTMGLENGETFALCLNAETGKEQWRTVIGDHFENRWGDGPRSTPTVDGEHVYFLAASGEVACLSCEKGKKVWSKKLTDFGGKAPNWGYSESPLVDGDLVVCTPGGKKGTVLALNKKTGKTVWQSSEIKEMAHYSSMVPADWGGQRQFIQLTMSKVFGVSAKDGSVLWQTDWPGATAVIPSPIFEEGKVYVTSGYGVGSKLVELDSDNSVSETWFSRSMKNHHGGVIKIGEHVYGHSDKTGWICQDFATGDLVWNEKAVKKGAVAYADGRFYHLQESDGKVLLLEASKEGLRQHGSFTLSPKTKRRKRSGKIWVHPVISDGKLYLRDQEIIHCYDISK